MKTFASPTHTPRWVSVFRRATAMTMPPRLRTFMLTLHVITSVGWLGAVAAYLVLAITGLTSRDVQRVGAAYLAMELTLRFVIVPLTFASLLNGIVSSLGTPWGLFRYYWVVVKLVLTLFATLVLLGYAQSIDYFAGIAAKTTLNSTDLRVLRDPMHAIHTGGALLVLLVLTVLSMYKPRGMTPYGWRKQQEQRTVLEP